jgi:aminopeptidase N
MRVAAAPLSNRGMEYPQVNLLGVELYNHFGDNLEILVAHEVAHQWWYQMVHNDPVKTPWLDEALAEYSVKLYFEALHGEGNADDLQNRRWQTPARSLQEREVETPLGWGVESFADGSQYEITVYGKGALFYDALRKILGERQFKRFLQSYLETYRYQIVDANDWLAAIRALQNPAVETLYEEWVTPTEPEPLPPASESPSASP